MQNETAARGKAEEVNEIVQEPLNPARLHHQGLSQGGEDEKESENPAMWCHECQRKNALKEGK